MFAHRSMSATLSLYSMRIRFAVLNPVTALRWVKTPRTIRCEITADEIAQYAGAKPVILEAGAANGVDTERLAKRFPDGLVIAVEPLPTAFMQCLERTAQLPNVIPFRVALSDDLRRSKLNVSRNLSDGSTDASSLLAPQRHLEFFPAVDFGASVEVECCTLDALIDDYKVPSPTVLRLDLQGMELRVLQASPRVLAGVETIVTEGSRVPLFSGGARFSDLRRFLTSQGFKLRIDRIGALSGNALFTRVRSSLSARP